MKTKTKINYFDAIRQAKLTAKEVQNKPLTAQFPFLSDGNIIPANPFFKANIDTGV